MLHQRAFDYVIVGAGAAGCVVAHRLAEDQHTRVLLLEAGPSDRSPLIHMPAGFHQADRQKCKLVLQDSTPETSEQP